MDRFRRVAGLSAALATAGLVAGALSVAGAAPAAAAPAAGSAGPLGGAQAASTPTGLSLALAAPATVDPGGQVTYELAVTNGSATTATAVGLAADLDPIESFQASGSSPGCGPAATGPAGAGPVVTCTVADISPGATQTLTLVATVGAGDAGRVALTCAGAEGTTPSSCGATVVTGPLALTAVAANNAADPAGEQFLPTAAAQAPGVSVTYLVTITNPSAGPEVLDSVSQASAGQPVTPVCTGLTGGSLPPGGSAYCQFPGTAPAAAGASQNVFVLVSAHDPTDPGRIGSAVATSGLTTPGTSMAADIYLCSATGASTAEVTGGGLSLAGPTTLASSANPLAPTPVAAGTYLISATAPAGYQFVTTCPGAAAATPPVTLTGATATGATATATVPAGAAATAVFYVVPTAPGLGLSVLAGSDAADPGGASVAPTATAARPGEAFTEQVTISNTDSQAVRIASVTAAANGGTPAAVCQQLVGTTLVPGQSLRCQFPDQAPAGPGASHTSTVTVSATNVPPDQAGGSVSATASSVVLTGPGAGLAATSDASGTGYGVSEAAAPGATSVPYRLVVLNPNASPATVIGLSDSRATTTTAVCSSLVGRTVAPGQSVTCDFTGPVPTTATTDTGRVVLAVDGLVATASAGATVAPAPAVPSPARPVPAGTTPNPVATAPLAPTAAPTVVAPTASGSTASAPTIVQPTIVGPTIVAPTAAGGPGSSLPNTGLPTAPLVGMALTMVAIGALLVMAADRTAAGAALATRPLPIPARPQPILRRATGCPATEHPYRIDPGPGRAVIHRLGPVDLAPLSRTGLEASNHPEWCPGRIESLGHRRKGMERPDRHPVTTIGAEIYGWPLKGPPP